MNIKIFDIAKKEASKIELNTHEQEVLSSYLINDENKVSYKELTFVLKQTSPETTSLNIDINVEWDRFKVLRDSTRKSKIRRLSIQISSVAAAILLIFGIFVFSNQESYQVNYTTNEKPEQFILPDHSKVTLNSNSSIAISNKFNKKSRSIILNGEGYFEINPNKTKPFTIDLPDNTAVEVLGTSFNLKSYENSVSTELHVTSGKVAFGYKNEAPKLILEKGKLARYSRNAESFESQDYSNAYISQWQSGEFKFDNTPVAQLMESFEHYFNKSIVFPSGNNLKYSGHFKQPKEDDLAQVLALAFGWDYKITEKQITFSEKK